MWRDVFLANKTAVLEMLARFNEDLSALQRAIRKGDGQMLEAFFTRTRAIRRSIIAAGQETAAADFGRRGEAVPHPDAATPGTAPERPPDASAGSGKQKPQS
jgi:cyclohexadieny/prephenate dehydrogenase